MSVKTIFKTLLGTIIIIVVSFVIVELFNVNMVSARLSGITKMCASNSADLFAQETYKTDRWDGALANINVAGGIDDNGNTYAGGDLYLSGAIYNGTTETDIWESLYNTEDYKRFASKFEGKWHNLDIMNIALENDSLDSLTPPDWNASNEEMQEYNDKVMAKTFRENLLTPLNIGVAYLDQDTLEKIFRWNLTQVLSNCNNKAIGKDAFGEYYVSYSGFRCYTNKASITSITYRVYDLSMWIEKEQFELLTSIDADRLGLPTAGEQSKVCIAYINYSMPVSYEGITPIKTLFEAIWGMNVQGLSESYTEGATKNWNDSTSNLTGGGAGDIGLGGRLPTTGRLMYYIIK